MLLPAVVIRGSLSVEGYFQGGVTVHEDNK